MSKKEFCNEIQYVAGREFICVLPYHGREYDKNGKRRPWKDARGRPSKWRRHYVKRRYEIGNH